MTEKHIYSVGSLEELTHVANSFMEKYPNNGIFLLRGEMGAGKTTFVKTICKALGMDDTSSPTFSLVNHYSNDKNSVYHFDLYRLKSLEEALDFGFDEYLEKQGYLFIEWPDLVEPLLPDDVVTISIDEEDGIRAISF